MFNHENKLGEKGFIEMNEEIRDIHIERRLSDRNRRELEGKREKDLQYVLRCRSDIHKK